MFERVTNLQKSSLNQIYFVIKVNKCFKYEQQPYKRYRNKLQQTEYIIIYIDHLVRQSIMTNRNESEEEIQRKMGLIFSKAEHILNSLNNYRQKITQSICYEDPDHAVMLLHNNLTFNNLFNITIHPNLCKHRPQYVSIGCQTQQKIVIKLKTQHSQNIQHSVNYSLQSKLSTYLTTANSDSHSRFASTTQVKQICLNRKINNSTQISSRMKSKSRGISVTSRNSSISTNTTKQKLKNNQKDRKRGKIIVLTNTFKNLKKSILK